MQQGAVLSLSSSGLSTCGFCVHVPFHLCPKSRGAWIWVGYFALLVEKNSGGPAGLYPMRSKETRFVAKIEGIFGQVVCSLLITTYHGFQLGTSGWQKAGPLQQLLHNVLNTLLHL